YVCYCPLPFPHSFHSHFRHHYESKLLNNQKNALKIFPTTADHAMLQPTLLKVADIVNDRLDTSRERESPAFATLLLDSDTAVNGENCAHNLTRIATGPFLLGTHFRKRVAIKLRSIEAMRGLAATGYQPLPSRPARLRAPSTSPPSQIGGCGSFTDFGANSSLWKAAYGPC